MLVSRKVLVALLACIVLGSHVGVAAAGVVINELMAANGNFVRDPQAQYDDWFELHNPGVASVDVGGMYVTDDLSVPMKWRIPTDRPAFTTIPAGGYLLVWADNDTADSGLHAAFELDAAGDEIGLFDTDGTTLIDSVAFEEQFGDISYGRSPNATGEWAFLVFPTPVGPNAGVYEGLVADPKFSHNRGFYSGPFEVVISCETPGVVVYYTLDGGTPYNRLARVPAGRIYTGPISITRTTCLCACAVRSGWLSSDVAAQTYIFLDDVVRQPAYPPGWPTNWGHTGRGDYEMDPQVVNDPRYRDTIKDDLQSVPTLSLVTDRDNWFGGGGQGIYLQGELDERPVSAELIFPDGQEGFQVNCAVMIVGGSSPLRWKMDKLSMRLKFQSQYGPSRLRFPVFGPGATDEFNTLVLDARMNNSWAYGGGVGVSRPGLGQRDLAQYTRDQFASDIQSTFGGNAPHGRHVHLYLNGLYWGLYWLHERPDEYFAAAYRGGQREDYDVLKHNSSTVINGSGAAYSALFSTANSGLASDVKYEQICRQLDVPDFINYMLVNYYIGNTDWAHQNWYASRSRTDPNATWRYHSWDAEHVMEGLYDDVTGRNDNGGPTRLHHQLVANAEYRLRFADHVHRHFFNDGALTPEGAAALYQIRLDEVDRAVVGESARWGDNQRSTPYTRDIEWVRERDWLLGTYFPQRTQIVLDRLKSRGWYPNVDAPIFHVNGSYRHGGSVATGDLLTIVAGGGVVYYTLDGTDPRVPGTTPQAGETVVLAAENARKRVLVPSGPVDDAWKSSLAFDDSAWISGTGGVGLETGSGNYPDYFTVDLRGEMYNKQATCYIRIPFMVSSPRFSDLVLKVRYDDGFIAYLNGVEVRWVNSDGTPMWNSSATSSHSDSDAVNFETFGLSSHISTLHAGVNLLAIHGLNQGASSSDFLISVELVGVKTPPGGTTVSGLSPTAIPYTGPIRLSASTHVASRVLSGSTWSALNEAVFAVGLVAESLRISELMYHPLDGGNPDDPNTEYVELINIGAETINVNMVQFTNGISFTFPSVDLVPGGYCLVVKDTAAFADRYGADLPVVGQYTGSLSNGGERIELRDAAGTIIHDFRFEDDWHDLTDGLGYSLTVDDPWTADPQDFGNKDVWRPSAKAGGSPGADDSG